MSNPAITNDTPTIPVDSTNAAQSRSRFVPARRALRVANFVIDTIAHFGLAVVVGIVVVLVWGERGAYFIESIPDILLGIAIQLIYYLVLEGTTCRTLGKLVTGTRVVDKQCGRPTMGQVVRRTFARLIPLDAVSYLKPSDRGWHDRLANTLVVERSP